MTPSRSPRYIAVEGPIGVGKTTFAKLLAERLGARTVLDEGNNPFLGDFYENPKDRAFQAQVYFLLSRYQQKHDFLQGDLFSAGGVVSDYLFAKDRIFAQLNLSRDELILYDKVYSLLGTQVTRPDLVVYLQAKADVLKERAKKKAAHAAHGAKAPSKDYLERVAEAYAEFFFHYAESPLLVVNTSEIDFVERREDLDDLLAVIQNHVAKKTAGISHYSPLGSQL